MQPSSSQLGGQDKNNPCSNKSYPDDYDYSGWSQPTQNSRATNYGYPPDKQFHSHDFHHPQQTSNNRGMSQFHIKNNRYENLYYPEEPNNDQGRSSRSHSREHHQSSSSSKRGHNRNERSRSPPHRESRKRPHDSHISRDHFDQGDHRQIDINSQTSIKKSEKVDSRKRKNSLEEGNQKDKKKASEVISDNNLVTNLSVSIQPTAKSVKQKVKVKKVTASITENEPTLNVIARCRELQIAQQLHRDNLQYNPILKELSEPFQVPEAYRTKFTPDDLNTILTFNTVIDNIYNAPYRVIRDKLRSLVDGVHSLTIPRNLPRIILENQITEDNLYKEDVDQLISQVRKYTTSRHAVQQLLPNNPEWFSVTCIQQMLDMESELLLLLETLDLQPETMVQALQSEQLNFSAEDEQSDKSQRRDPSSDDDSNFDFDENGELPDIKPSKNPSGSNNGTSPTATLSLDDQTLPRTMLFPPVHTRERHPSRLQHLKVNKDEKINTVTIDKQLALSTLTTPCDSNNKDQVFISLDIQPVELFKSNQLVDQREIPTDSLHHEVAHCLVDKPNIISEQLARQLCSPHSKVYPSTGFDNFATVYTKALRSNNGIEDPSFAKIADDIDSIKLSYDLLKSRTKIKRKITGFSFNDLKLALFKAHDSCLPEYFSGAASCQNIIAARALLDPSSCKNISGSRKSKVLGHAYQNLQQKMDCVKSINEFKTFIDNHKDHMITSTSSDELIEGAQVHPSQPWFKGNFHLAPEMAMQAIGNLNLPPSIAILDSGCMKHFITAVMRQLLSNLRNKNIRMLDAGGHISILTEEGDLEVQLEAKDGSALPPLPLKNCSISPNSPFNLFSISQLNRDNINVRMSNNGDYLEFNGSRFKLIRLHGLYLIDLLKPLRAYAEVQQSVPAMVSFVELETSSPLNFGGLSATLGRWHMLVLRVSNLLQHLVIQKDFMLIRTNHTMQNVNVLCVFQLITSKIIYPKHVSLRVKFLKNVSF